MLQRAFSPEGLSEMWNEMVKDEEIVFDREEHAYPGEKHDHNEYFFFVHKFNITITGIVATTQSFLRGKIRYTLMFFL